MSRDILCSNGLQASLSLNQERWFLALFNWLSFQEWPRASFQTSPNGPYPKMSKALNLVSLKLPACLPSGNSSWATAGTETSGASVAVGRSRRGICAIVTVLVIDALTTVLSATGTCGYDYHPGDNVLLVKFQEWPLGHCNITSLGMWW